MTLRFSDQTECVKIAVFFSYHLHISRQTLSQASVGHSSGKCNLHVLMCRGFHPSVLACIKFDFPNQNTNKKGKSKKKKRAKILCICGTMYIKKNEAFGRTEKKRAKFCERLSFGGSKFEEKSFNTWRFGWDAHGFSSTFTAEFVESAHGCACFTEFDGFCRLLQGILIVRYGRNPLKSHERCWGANRRPGYASEGGRNDCQGTLRPNV